MGSGISRDGSTDSACRKARSAGEREVGAEPRLQPPEPCVVPYLGAKRLDEITTGDLNELQGRLLRSGLKPPTIDGVIHSALRAMLRDAALLGFTPTGAPIDQANFYQREWLSMLRRLRVRPRPFYNTRHTYITEMLAIGVDPLFVARQTGTSLEMIEKHYAKTTTVTDELDEMIADATAAKTGNLPGTLPDHEHDADAAQKKTPEIIGGFSESRRPGSNRRRPAWEASEGQKRTREETLRKDCDAKSLRLLRPSRGVPQYPVRNPKDPERFRVETVTNPGQTLQGLQLDSSEFGGSSPNSDSTIRQRGARFDQPSAFSRSWLRLADVGPKRSHFRHSGGPNTTSPSYRCGAGVSKAGRTPNQFPVPLTAHIRPMKRDK